MATQDTLYIAEPIFSENLQRFDSNSSFPPIKKIGITTGHPKRRERELLGTLSPVKISIRKAWTDIDARAVEVMLHTILDNTRLDGEYFWDGNETLVDAVTEFMRIYHPQAKEIVIRDDEDVKAATNAAAKQRSQRAYIEVVPQLDKLDIKYTVFKNGKGTRFKLGDYTIFLGGRSGGRYTMTIFSKTKTTEDTLQDFPDAQELTASATEESNRRARIPMTDVDTIVAAIKRYIDAH